MSSIYHFLFPIVILLVASICLLVYVIDLRKQVKEQALVIRQQHLLSRRQRANLEFKNEDKLSKEERLFVDVCQYMDEKEPFLNPDLRIEDLAKAVNTNRTTLAECVRKYSGGLTLLQFITRSRLRYAASILEMPDLDLTMAEVGEASGFKSRSVFNHQFSLLYNCAPSEFRSQFLSHEDGDTPSRRENTLEK